MNRWQIPLTKKYVIPKIKEFLPQIKEIHHIEDLSVGRGDIINMLDLKSAIDALASDGDSVFGISLRALKYKRYNTFTIRYEKVNGVKTEWEKLLYSYVNCCLMPRYMCMAYFEKEEAEEILLMGMAETKNILEVAIKELKTNTNGSDNTNFIYVDFSNVKDTKVYKNPQFDTIVKRMFKYPPVVLHGIQLNKTIQKSLQF